MRRPYQDSLEVLLLRVRMLISWTTFRAHTWHAVVGNFMLFCNGVPCMGKKMKQRINPYGEPTNGNLTACYRVTLGLF